VHSVKSESSIRWAMPTETNNGGTREIYV